jgi:5-methylcytosine-specific restriction enzyme A
VIYHWHSLPKKAKEEPMDPYDFYPDASDLKREKRKARELRASQWWKRRCARGRCHYCGRATAPAELTMDHVVPIARGGKTSKGNVVACCKACNNQKKSLLPMEWEAYLQNQKDSIDRQGNGSL